MRIGIIAAMNVEMNILLDNIKDVKEEKFLGYSFHSGVINGNEIVLVESGVGKVNASVVTTILIYEYCVELIINTGIAGGVNDVAKRDVVIASGLSWHDFDIRIFGYQYGQVPEMPKVLLPSPEGVMLVKSVLNKLHINYKEGIVVSGDTFVLNRDALKQVEDLHPLACEMEGTGVAQVATKAGVDFVVLRYISDVVGEENQEDDYLEFEDEMANMSANICLKLIENIEA